MQRSWWRWGRLGLLLIGAALATHGVFPHTMMIHSASARVITPKTVDPWEW